MDANTIDTVKTSAASNTRTLVDVVNDPPLDDQLELITPAAMVPIQPAGVVKPLLVSFSCGEMKGMYIKRLDGEKYNGDFYITNIANMITRPNMYDWQHKSKPRKKFYWDMVEKHGSNLIQEVEGAKILHKSIVENVLRYYGVDEDTINKASPPSCRTVKQYRYGKFPVKIHTQSEYFDLTYMLEQTGKRAGELKRSAHILKLLRARYRQQHGREYDGDDIWSEFASAGLGHGNHMWLDNSMITHVACWCSCDYAFMVSEIMSMFHNDPMKLAALALNEHDRQTGLHSVAVIHSTDDLEQHTRLVAELEEKVRELEAHNDRIINHNHQLTNHNSGLEIANLSIREQAKPFLELQNGYGFEEAANIAMNRKKVLDLYALKYDTLLTEKEVEIDLLRTENRTLAAASVKSNNTIDVLSEALESVEDERDMVELELLEYAGTKKKKKIGRRITKGVPSRASRAALRASQDGPGLEPGSITTGNHSVYVYSKRDGANFVVAFLSGKANDPEKMQFRHHGAIQLDDSLTSEKVIHDFAVLYYDSLRNATHSSFEFSAPDAASLEVLFTNQLKGKIKSKTTDTGYQISNTDLLTDY
jgi:hypothetical protein